MKHLKTYKLFDNSNSDLLSVAKDTFLELEDEYYHVSISMFPHGVNAFIIDVSKSESFRWYDVNYYFETHNEKLSKLYCRESHVELDEKLFNDEYRQMLLDAGKYILYVYLKPDDETRLEIIFNEYNDFKHWINGLEEVLNNKQTKDIIKKKLI